MKISAIMLCTLLACVSAYAGSKAHVSLSPNAAVISWTCDNLEAGATSFVEYGRNSDLGEKTAVSKDPRLNQIHWLSRLEPSTIYHYRTVTVSSSGKRLRSKLTTFRTLGLDKLSPVKATKGPITLGQGSHYLTQDLAFSGTGIKLTGNATLDLNGFTLTYGDGQHGRHFGVLVEGNGVTIRNGRVVQSSKATRASVGNGGSYGIGSFGRAQGTSITGVDVYVHQHGADPLCFLNRATDVVIRHSRFVSDVKTLKSRHYPGANLVRIDAKGGKIQIANNIILRGCHRGIAANGEADTMTITANDIEHTQAYVNGYALNLSGRNILAKGNRITSTGRGVHITGGNIELANNYISTRQHMVYDDRGSEWRHYYTENHAVKLENCGTGVKIHHNKVLSTQPLPEPSAPAPFYDALKGKVKIKEYSAGLSRDRAHFAAATALNFHVKPDTQAEIYQNEFIAITKYKTSANDRGYGRVGEWAAALRIVQAPGKSPANTHAVHIHDNTFSSNDCLVRADGKLEQTIRIERNSFNFLRNPTTNHAAFRGGARNQIRENVEKGRNTGTALVE